MENECSAILKKNISDMKLYMLVNADCFIMHIRWVIVLCFSFQRYSLATSKCYNLDGNAPADW
ncbi:hypothetical protein T06_9790 [Trichinella sp. T6]|nr:hypothetical protein T06_9790 [Trichinella sp. T6]